MTTTIETSFELKPEHDIRNLEGAPGWHELTTPDPQAAAEYLGDLYGWTFQLIDIGGAEYRVIQLDGHEIGGIKAPMPGETDAPRWDTYVTVDDVDATAAKAERLGGTVLVPPMQLGDAGRLTVVVHPAAGKLSAFEYPHPFT